MISQKARNKILLKCVVCKDKIIRKPFKYEFCNLTSHPWCTSIFEVVQQNTKIIVCDSSKQLLTIADPI